MVIDQLIGQIKRKRNPCIVGIDPEWSKIPDGYKQNNTSEAEAIRIWAFDVVDAVADIVPAIKPQMAFFEVYGAEGGRVHQQVVQYAHQRNLLVIDDSKRNDIGNTASAYAYAHLAKDGPINADFMTISPFLGTDSMQPFVDVAVRDGKGLFVLVKTSNPSSVEISEAKNGSGVTIRDWLADYVHQSGMAAIGNNGYSSIGAVVGATFPGEAKQLRTAMPNNFFLVPGFGAQGGCAKDVLPCFNQDGLGAVINSSRGILYHHQQVTDYDGNREGYRQIVRCQAMLMQQSIYQELRKNCAHMSY